MRFVHTRHEEEAAFAAVGYANFTGKPAVVITTSGPHATHILNGLYDAAVKGSTGSMDLNSINGHRPTAPATDVSPPNSPLIKEI